MTQAQLYQLYIDSLELMVHDDITEVFNLLDYLAQKYALVFNKREAELAYFRDTTYTPPKEL